MEGSPTRGTYRLPHPLHASLPLMTYSFQSLPYLLIPGMDLDLAGAGGRGEKGEGDCKEHDL